MPDTVEPRKGREGGRWINERPTSEEFAKWFESSMKIDPSLKSEDYIGGIVLIPAVDEKVRYIAGFNEHSGEPIISQRPELNYVPYAKVETRVAYFWDLLDAHPEWIGVVENVPAPRLPIDPVQEALEVIVETEIQRRTENYRYRLAGALAQTAHQLPEGFSLASVPVGQGFTHFLCATIRVSIFDREQYEKNPARAVPLRTGRGTKQVPLLMGRSNPWADPNSLMKAETGALGRALGFAGIFVIPGSGVATAEDMLEAMSQGQTAAEAAPADNSGPAAPSEAPVRSGAEQAADEERQLQTRAAGLWQQLQTESPERAQSFGEWMRERGHKDLRVSGPALRGVVRKLEKLIDEAGRAGQQAPTEAPTDAPISAEAPSGESSGQAG